MVCDPEKTAPDAAGLGFCPGLDHVVCFDGDCGFPDLARDPVWKTAAEGSPFIWGSVSSKRPVAVSLFRAAVSSGRAGRHRRPGRLHFFDPSPLPSHFLPRRDPPHPLSPVGGLCRRFEFLNLHSKLLRNNQAHGLKKRSPLFAKERREGFLRRPFQKAKVLKFL